jgi:hypothetical protein
LSPYSQWVLSFSFAQCCVIELCALPPLLLLFFAVAFVTHLKRKKKKEDSNAAFFAAVVVFVVVGGAAAAAACSSVVSRRRRKKKKEEEASTAAAPYVVPVAARLKYGVLLSVYCECCLFCYCGGLMRGNSARISFAILPSLKSGKDAIHTSYIRNIY